MEQGLQNGRGEYLHVRRTDLSGANRLKDSREPTWVSTVDKFLSCKTDLPYHRLLRYVYAHTGSPARSAGGCGCCQPVREHAQNTQRSTSSLLPSFAGRYFLFIIKKPQMTACQETFGAHMSMVNGHNKRLYYIYSRASYWVSRGMPEGLIYLRNVRNNFGENMDKWKKLLKILRLTTWWVSGLNPSTQSIQHTSDLSCLGIEVKQFLKHLIFFYSSNTVFFFLRHIYILYEILLCSLEEKKMEEWE